MDDCLLSEKSAGSVFSLADMQAGAKIWVLGFCLNLCLQDSKFTELQLLLKTALAMMSSEVSAAAARCHLSLCPGSWPGFSSTSSHVGLATGSPRHRQILGLNNPCQSLEKLQAACIWWLGSLGLQSTALDGLMQACHEYAG